MHIPGHVIDLFMYQQTAVPYSTNGNIAYISRDMSASHIDSCCNYNILDSHKYQVMFPCHSPFKRPCKGIYNDRTIHKEKG